MAVTKIGGMLRTGKINKIIFATVDKSPHCIQMHYIQVELRKMMNIDHIDIKNYVIVDNKLEEISADIISMSRSLLSLKQNNIKASS